MATDSTAVIDIGSHTVKAGVSLHFPQESAPEVVIESRIQDSNGYESPVAYRGEIVNWEAADCILDYVLYEKLGWERGREGSILLCEPLSVTRSDREKMALLLFERFGVEGVFVQDSAVLSLYAMGRVTGCVVDCGHSKMDVAPVYEGLMRSQGLRRLSFGGENLTSLLAESLSISAAAAENLKEKCSTVCDLQEVFEGLDGSEMEFELPDGQKVNVSERKRALVGEALFRPEMMGMEGPGMAEAVYAGTYAQADLPSKRLQIENLLICGGGSLIPNLPARLFKELQCLLPASFQPGFITCPEYMPSNTQQYAAWMGGAILSKVVTQHGHLATKADYEEFGPSVLDRKFNTSF